MPSKKPSPAITDDLRKAWEETIRRAVHPSDYKIKNIDDVIPVPVVKHEVNVTIEDKVEEIKE